MKSSEVALQAEIKQNLVIVNDDAAVLASLKLDLGALAAHMAGFGSHQDALHYCQESAQKNPPAVVICGLRKQALAGCSLLQDIKQRFPLCHAILLSSGEDSAANIQQNVKEGELAYVDSYLAQPWSTDELLRHVKQVLAALPQSFPHSLPRADDRAFHGIITHSQNMFDIFKCIRRLATNNVPIFICGETGTGKELIAKACHHESARREQPFVAVNCANFTESLMESQLFGHKKGAFTGAVNDQPGLFCSAKKGTLFLDEVTTIPINLQSKLLRVIQEREFTPVGSHHAETFHAQIITASSKTLKQAVDDGEFREDLFYRLNIIFIHLPPLRDRGDDITLIAQYYLAKFSAESNKEFKRLSGPEVKQLANYAWPGNIRQLENFIHCLVILNDGPDISEQMMSEAFRLIEGGADPRASQKKKNHLHGRERAITPLWLMEKAHIEKAIEACHGNVYRAAALLEISPSTIYRKQQSWKLSP